jgi:hypothetical protein
MRREGLVRMGVFGLGILCWLAVFYALWLMAC